MSFPTTYEPQNAKQFPNLTTTRFLVRPMLLRCTPVIVHPMDTLISKIDRDAHAGFLNKPFLYFIDSLGIIAKDKYTRLNKAWSDGK